jgi:hypothetical protein
VIIWKAKNNLENGIHYMQKNVMPYEKLNREAKYRQVPAYWTSRRTTYLFIYFKNHR